MALQKLGLLLFLVPIKCILSEVNAESTVCNHPCSSSLNNSYVVKFCDEYKQQMQARCCVNNTGSNKVLGIDLHDCGISDVTGLFQSMTSLKVILLQGNPLRNVSSQDLEALVHLEYLALPANLTCPGGAEAWSHEETNSTQLLCLNETDFCRSANMSCPAGSQCRNTGPGLTECVCSSGYHGYKCLREGTFPTLAFTLGIICSTFVVSGGLWFTGRRKVKKIM